MGDTICRRGGAVLALLLTGCLLGPPAQDASGQELPRSSDFFEKGHAGSPLVGYEVEIAGRRKRAERQSPQRGPSLAADASAPSPTPSPQPQPGGLKVLSIGAVINSYNEKHFNAEVDKLLKVADKYDLNVGEVFTIGPETKENTKNDLPLLARGAVIVPQFFIPAEYDIRVSPTWILTTSEGQILLEGVTSVERYLNMRGEFIEKGMPDTQPQRAPIVDKGVSFFDER